MKDHLFSMNYIITIKIWTISLLQLPTILWQISFNPSITNSDKNNLIFLLLINLLVAFKESLFKWYLPLKWWNQKEFHFGTKIPIPCLFQLISMHLRVSSLSKNLMALSFRKHLKFNHSRNQVLFLNPEGGGKTLFLSRKIKLLQKREFLLWASLLWPSNNKS